MTDDNTGAREWWAFCCDGEWVELQEFSPGQEIHLYDGKNGYLRVIEHAAFEQMRKERDEARELANAAIHGVRQEIISELRDWQRKAMHEIEQMNNGRPSEWAYSVLRKERDELELALKRADREAASECAELRNECAETHARIHIAQEEHTALRAKLERAEMVVRVVREQAKTQMWSASGMFEALAAYDKETGG